jgi:hypothetical protein
MLKAGTACALVVLPPYMSRSRAAKLRRHIKRTLSPEVRTKCILASEIMKRLPPKGSDNHEKSGKYQSYLTYTALDLLVTSGYRLWALAEPLHYDLYIGIDVLNNTAGFTFVADGGAICRFVASTSEQKEALSAEQVAHIITTQLRQLIPRIKEAYGRLPRHIIIHRDGKWHDSESMGLRHAVEQLFREGLLLADVLVGVVEIQKTNAQHWRVFGRENNRVMNPIVGAYHIFGPETALICTTGYPAFSHATAEPLVVRIAEGNLDIEKVVRDVYWLSTLVWTKPDGIQSTPITIKLADNWLEPIAAKVSENEAMFEAITDVKSEKGLIVPPRRTTAS